MMNDEERSLDLQLGDALAEIERLKAERDEYAVAADKLAWECKALRDAAQVGLDAHFKANELIAQMWLGETP